MLINRYRKVLALCALGTFSVFSVAQEMACRAIVSDAERLACYDESVRSKDQTGSPELVTTAVPDTIAKKEQRPALSTGAASKEHVLVSSLTERWDLDPDNKRGTFVLLPYKPIYLLPFTYTDRVNQSPSASGHATPLPTDLNAAEAKFQLSFKTKAAQSIFGDNGDLWLGYTQSSRWQVYNGGLSRPFRETNYEPEAMLVFRTNYELFGFKGTMASVGLNHQSNGRASPLSRSWNRVIAEAGFERGDWMVTLRPWWRLPESDRSDDNPEIENYVGRGELMVARKWRDHVFSVQARHSLRGGKNSRGSAQLSWSFPVAGDLKGYVQLFSGYGESMIDYNHRQTMIGAGLTVHDWF